MPTDRILHPGLRQRIVSAEHAATLIQPGETVAMSGFTGSGYPKAVPQSLARRIEQAHERGEDFRINLLTGASTAPELDGALAKAEGLALRMPFQTDPDARKRINSGELDYIDIHLSHVAQHVWFGFYGDIDTAVITLKLANGAIGVIDNSRKAVYGYDQRAEVFGSKGAIQISNDTGSSAVFSGEHGVVAEKPKYFFLERYMQSFADEISCFVDSVVNDKPTVVNGDDGLQPVLIALAAKKSMEEGRPVRISEVNQ